MKRLVLTFSIILVLMLLMDSCMQFRMSKTEIDQYFQNKKRKGTLHQYEMEGRTINYLQVPNPGKPLVVFVHGSPGSLSAFIDFLSDSALLEKAEMISVDRPGFGASNFGNGCERLKQQVDYLKPILESNKDKRPIILIGHSLGGPFIAKMAMDYPQLVDGLVIVAGSVDPDLEPNETWFRAPLSTPFLKWVLPRSFRASNDEIYHLKPDLQNMLPQWKNITCPVIIIQGSKDSLVDPGNAEFARKMLVNSPSVEIVYKEGMDHFVPWSNPELIREAILKLLSRSNNVTK